MKLLAKARRKALTTATLISFSLTFVAAGLALLLGLLPYNSSALASSLGPVDAGVVLLMVPVGALVLAILVEAVRLTIRGPIQIDEPKPVGTLTEWKAGHGEG